MNLGVFEIVLWIRTWDELLDPVPAYYSKSRQVLSGYPELQICRSLVLLLSNHILILAKQSPYIWDFSLKYAPEVLKTIFLWNSKEYFFFQNCNELCPFVNPKASAQGCFMLKYFPLRNGRCIFLTSDINTVSWF